MAEKSAVIAGSVMLLLRVIAMLQPTSCSNNIRSRPRKLLRAATARQRPHSPSYKTGLSTAIQGTCLIFPPVLRILCIVLPSEFPFHPNWKRDVTHHAYWEIGATVDHPVPVTRGGADDESSWVTTSVARNSAKMNWTLDELGWTYCIQPVMCRNGTVCSTGSWNPQRRILKP